MGCGRMRPKTPAVSWPCHCPSRERRRWPRNAGAISASRSTCSGATCWPTGASFPARWSTCRRAASRWSRRCPASPGERVIAYVDHLGRLEGKIARMLDNGFAMTIEATLRKRDKLAAQLTWLANRHILNLPEDRRHGRFIPRKTMARLILPNGNNVACRVIDLSESGAAIAISPELRPRSAPWSPSERPRAGWSVISRTALPSNSPACSIPTSSKKTSPANSLSRR